MKIHFTLASIKNHEVSVYTVKIGLNYKQEPNFSFLSLIQAVQHVHIACINIVPVASHSLFVHEPTLS